MFGQIVLSNLVLFAVIVLILRVSVSDVDELGDWAWITGAYILFTIGITTSYVIYLIWR